MEKPRKHYVAEVRGADGLERTLYLTATSASSLRQSIVARGYRVVSIRLDRRPREEIEREEAQPAAAATEEAANAVRRLVQVLLEQAASQGARTISAEVARRGVKVSHLIGEEWREVMTLPRDAWPPLRQRFAELAGLPAEVEAEQAGELTFTHGGGSRTARMTISAEQARIELCG